MRFRAQRPRGYVSRLSLEAALGGSQVTVIHRGPVCSKIVVALDPNEVVDGGWVGQDPEYQDPHSEIDDPSRP